MIDIHCHIAPGLDDGPLTMATSLTMAKIAAADGIEVIFATPHADGALITPERLGAEVSNLNRCLSERKIPVTVVPGFEIPHFLALDLAATHTLAGSTFVLIEFPHDFMPLDAPLLIRTLIGRGFQPIIAHPERNRDILLDPQRIAPHVEAGALLQVTAASITGEFGPDCQRCAHYLLSRSLAHFIATDSHSPNFRTPMLSKARAMAKKVLDAERATQLVSGNPRKILMAGHPPHLV